MPKYALFTEAGFPSAFYSRDINGDDIPPDAVEITDDQWMEFIGNNGLRRWDGSEVVEYAPPTPPPFTHRTYKADVWRRATDAQADAIDTELTKLGTRQRRLWDDAQYLDHSDELVVMLRSRMVAAFGADEADRILAPSE